MKNYYRIMAGHKSMQHIAQCQAGRFIGADYGIDVDLTDNRTSGIYFKTGLDLEDTKVHDIF